MNRRERGVVRGFSDEACPWLFRPRAPLAAIHRGFLLYWSAKSAQSIVWLYAFIADAVIFLLLQNASGSGDLVQHPMATQETPTLAASVMGASAARSIIGKIHGRFFGHRWTYSIEICTFVLIVICIRIIVSFINGNGWFFMDPTRTMHRITDQPNHIKTTA